jgi:hypothetical protein
VLTPIRVTRPIISWREPRGRAVVFGFGNTFAQIPGIVGVAVTGWLVDVTSTYSAAFVLTAIVSTAGALMFGLLFDPVLSRRTGSLPRQLCAVRHFA